MSKFFGGRSDSESSSESESSSDEEIQVLIVMSILSCHTLMNHFA